MKKILSIVVAVMACGAARAQFLDPQIIRSAGEAMATGNIRLNNLEIDNVYVGGQGGQRAPTAAEVAAEVRRQEASERALTEFKRLAAEQARIARVIASAYDAEFGRR